MSKYLKIIPIISVLMIFSGCFRTATQVSFVIPAGTESRVIYSDMEFSPKGNNIEVSPGDRLGDTSVSLKQVETGAQSQGQYLTGGLTVKLSAEKGKWYQIGIVGHNPTDEDITVSVIVSGAEVRNS